MDDLATELSKNHLIYVITVSTKNFFIKKKNININNKMNPYKYDNIHYNTIFEGISNHDLNKYIDNIINF